VVRGHLAKGSVVDERVTCMCGMCLHVAHEGSHFRIAVRIAWVGYEMARGPRHALSERLEGGVGDGGRECVGAQGGCEWRSLLGGLFARDSEYEGANQQCDEV